MKAKKKKDDAPVFDFSKAKEIPFVTVQLPLYNELYVVERLLENISKLDYPKDKLEIQVLDDSTDESLQTTRNTIEALQAAGIPIQHITRSNRKGFKAGALKEGLAIAKGEFIAIFDSDFVPNSDWLQKTVPYFKDEKISLIEKKNSNINIDALNPYRF